PSLGRPDDARCVPLEGLVARGVARLICLIGGNHVAGGRTRPLNPASMRYSGTNEVWTVAWGTNILKVLKLTDEQQALYGSGPYRFKAWQIGLQPNGTNGFLVMLAPDQKTDATT